MMKALTWTMTICAIASLVVSIISLTKIDRVEVKLDKSLGIALNGVAFVNNGAGNQTGIKTEQK